MKVCKLSVDKNDKRSLFKFKFTHFPSFLNSVGLGGGVGSQNPHREHNITLLMLESFILSLYQSEKSEVPVA